MRVRWTNDVHGVPTPAFEFDQSERDAILYALGWALDSKGGIHHLTTEKVFKTFSQIDAAMKAMAEVERQ